MPEVKRCIRSYAVIRAVFKTDIFEMQKITLIQYLLLFALLVGLPAQVYCSPLWDSFLRQPASSSYVELKSTFTKAPQLCTIDTQLSERQISQLETYIQEGNRYAFRAAVIYIQCMYSNSAGLEDIYRSIGIYFDTHPHDFLEVAIKEPISNNDLKYMVTMLPLALVDNSSARHAAIKHRIALLNAIQDPSLLIAKNKLLIYLKSDLD